MPKSGLIFILVAAAAFAQTPASLPLFSTFLKANSTIQQIAVDSQGYIYVFGSVDPPVPLNPSDQVFIARLNPAATQFLYVTYLGGSSTTIAGAMAIDAAGNAYVTGYTSASDFTTVPQVPGPSSPNTQTPYAAKIATNGAIVYSTLFANGVNATPQSIAVDSNGEAIVSGNSAGAGFPVTPGAYNNRWFPLNLPFTTKLDATGSKLIFSEIGIGGSSLALDASGNIFIAGTVLNQGVTQYPTTSGAFQTSYTQYTYCVFPCQIAYPAGEQYVTKLSADGSTLIYSTFVTGSQGSYNAGLVIDASGNAWVTGDTTSPDYPYTQPRQGAASQTFTTELDPTGSRILASFPAGVPPGAGNNLSFDSQGNLVMAGYFPLNGGPSNSQTGFPNPALPSTGNAPPQCVPGGSLSVPTASYAMRMDSHAGTILSTLLFPGSMQTVASAIDSQGNVYLGGTLRLPDIPLTPGVVYDPVAAERTVPGAYLIRAGFAGPASPIGCVTDATDATLIGPVAPGQLLTIYGNNIGPAQPAIGIVNGATSAPTSLAGVTVSFDGHLAPILYASSGQINLQVPYEADRNIATTMQLNFNGSTLGTRTFVVTNASPSVFIASVAVNPVCGSLQDTGTVWFAFALNEDGSVNSCSNPAKAGSQVSLFINGLGTGTNNRNTGVLTQFPGPDYGPAAVFLGDYSTEVDSFMDQYGAISGIGQLIFRIPNTITSAGYPIGLTVSVQNLLAGPLIAADEAIPVSVFAAP
jgi:uncharacterized protein (TIGR03437 family)